MADGRPSGDAQNGDERTRQRLERSFLLGRVFSPSAPIDQASLFRGRTAQVRDVLDAIAQRGQHVILFGERGVGKTSLANVIGEILEGAGQNVLSPRVNCDKTDDFTSVWRKIFAEIPVQLRRRATGFGATEQRELSNLGAQLAERSALLPDDVRHLLRDAGAGGVLVVIIDEFDRLKPEARSFFADTIKTLSDHAVAVTVMLVGVGQTVADLIAEHESVTRSLVQVKMPRMSDDELIQIVQGGLPSAGLTMADDALRDVLVMAQGLPHYMHLLSLYAARSAVERDSARIEQQDLQNAVGSAVSRAFESITRAYHQAISSARVGNLYPQVLLACALAEQDFRGTFSAADVREPMQRITGRPYDIPAYSPHLNAFCETDRGPVLEKSGTLRTFRFRFVDPLLQPYVLMRGVSDGMLKTDEIRNSPQTDTSG